MGFITDLFKEKVDWNEDELMALFGYLSAMGAADGVVDKNESAAIAAAVTGLPSKTNWNLETFERIMKRSLEIKPEKHIDVLKSMHRKKKDIALGALGVVAAVDGEFDDDELAFWNGMRIALQ